jgi:hypothetical protein
MSTRASRPSLLLPAVIMGLLITAAVVLAGRASAATITASYAAGHREVSINDYGTQALGTFTMRFDPGDPAAGTSRLALCVEADTPHSTVHNAYRLVSNRVVSSELDYLLWKYGWPGTPEYVDIGADHDTATALAGLAWYYAGATRRGGGAVWANWATGFGAVTPISPHRWDALAQFGASFPVGLRSAGRDLDAAERRVFELFVEASARRGPWKLDPVVISGSTASVRVTGPAGPIAGLRGVRILHRGADGRVRADEELVTDAQGIASLATLDLSAGGVVEVTLAAPGPHQEWDGDGAIQRMATATSVQLSGSAMLPTPPTAPATTLPATTLPRVPPAPPTTTMPTTTTMLPPPRHLRVEKRSSDPVFSPAGASFELLDALDRQIELRVTDEQGSAAFAPIDPTAHPGPYRLRERSAPVGLRPIGGDLLIEPPYSTDPQAPTVVSVTNHPLTPTLRVHKHLSEPDLGPGDLSGFGFSVERLADGRDLGRLMTAADGLSEEVAVTHGAFRVCELSQPAWATGLIDPGCTEVEIDTQVTMAVVAEYVNLVPSPGITTRLVDLADGDQVLSSTGGTLVDRVTLTGLVGGTTYTLRGELSARSGEGEQHSLVPTGITATAQFVAESDRAELEMLFEVGPDPSFTVAVAVQELFVGDRVVATHADPSELSQTVWIPRISSRAKAVDSPIANLAVEGDQLIDEVTHVGLPPGPWTAQLRWYERGPDGVCTPTDRVAEAAFTVDEFSGPGTVLVGSTPVDAAMLGRTLVATQRLVQRSPNNSNPDESDPVNGNPDESDPDNGADTVIDHADCADRDQTIWIPRISTRATSNVVAGDGVAVDEITVTALPDPLPQDWTITASGGLYQHGPGLDHQQQRCTRDNLLSSTTVAVTGNGTWATPGEPHGPGSFSYDQRLRVATGNGLVWESARHGCTSAEQSFDSLPVALAAPNDSTQNIEVQPPPPADSPTLGSPGPAGPAGPLPRTGSALARTIATLGAAIIVVGVLALAWGAKNPSRRTPFPARPVGTINRLQ